MLHKHSIQPQQKIAWYTTLAHPDNAVKLQSLLYQAPRQILPSLHMVLLDSSASLLRQQGLSDAKGILQYLCQQLYLQRELLTLITFGNQQVDTVYPVQTAPKSIAEVLNNIQGGGGTPLNSALEYIAQLAKQYPQHPQALYILTDARTHIPFKSPPLKMSITVIDMENHIIQLSKAQQLAHYLQADYLSLSQLDILT